jgi:hypothetical protein
LWRDLKKETVDFALLYDIEAHPPFLPSGLWRKCILTAKNTSTTQRSHQ